MSDKQWYFDDFVPGQEIELGQRTVSEDEIIAFATQFDPQPFHLSDEAAAQTHFGRLSASGWHTCAMTMAMLVENLKAHKQAGLGSPGIDELKWLRPVYPGDVLRCESELIDKRVSASRPEMGIFKTLLTVFNQDDVAVMSYRSNGLIRTRPPGAAASG